MLAAEPGISNRRAVGTWWVASQIRSAGQKPPIPETTGTPNLRARRSSLTDRAAVEPADAGTAVGDLAEGVRDSDESVFRLCIDPGQSGDPGSGLVTLAGSR